jgi:hypothetical protein
MVKVNKECLYLITGKNTDGVLLMIPVYNPAVGQYLADKYIADTYWSNLLITNPDNQIIYKR